MIIYTKQNWLNFKMWTWVWRNHWRYVASEVLYIHQII